jgi:hypothetical protein
MEHGHIIKVRVYSTNPVWEWTCTCGEGAVLPERIAKAQIMAHRMEVFPKVREALAQ